MNRSGPKFSLQEKQAKQQQQQQQKQKKKLSFRDPEVEGPQQQSQIFGGCRPKAIIPSVKAIPAKKENSITANLSLEDQALQIAQSVGSAFSGLNFQTDFNSTEIEENIKDSLVETNIDEFPGSNSSYERRNQFVQLKYSPEDRDYLEKGSMMRCPTIEPSEQNSAHNSIPAIEPIEEKFPSSAQHQIQMLKYQLDQQTQQKQMAFYQVQLLTDQMEAECAARHKAQEQNNQLMTQNQELLNHIEKLFQQIEELERQIRLMEQEKRSKIPQHQESQISQPRPSLYMGTRRLSGDQSIEAKPIANRAQTSTRGSFTSTKPLLTQSKITPTSMQPNTLAQTRRSSLTSPKPFTAAQTRNDSTLHIGDTSPPIQSGTLSPFGSAWRLKSPEPSREKSPTVPERTRTSSFSSFSKLKPPEINTKTSLYGGSNSASTNISNKKHSSSTSDLYNQNAYHSSKPSLTIEDTSKGAISNVNTTPISKLPRYQAYTGWQRRSSLSKEYDQQSPVTGKEKLRQY